MSATKVREMLFKVDIVVEPDDDGFHAYAPALRGVHVGGETQDEALQNARDAVVAYLRSLIIDGEPIPLTPEVVVDDPIPEHTHHPETLSLLLNQLDPPKVGLFQPAR